MRVQNRILFVLVIGLVLGAATRAHAMTPENAAGIPWGASPEAVKAAMKARPQVVLDEDTADHLLFKGGNLAGMPIEFWRVEFVRSKMTVLNVRFVLPEGGDGKGSFADQTRGGLRRQLDQKFGRTYHEEGNNWYHSCAWKWPSMTVKGAFKEVSLMDAWHDGHLELWYTDHAPPAEPTPANPSATAKPNYFGQPGTRSDL